MTSQEAELALCLGFRGLGFGFLGLVFTFFCFGVLWHNGVHMEMGVAIAWVSSEATR